MKNVIRSVGGLATCVLGVCLLCGQVRAGFDLRIDGGSLREVAQGSYEIDAFLDINSSVPSPPTIQSLLLNLTLRPANGFSIGDITGARFDGVRNADTNRLFVNPTVHQPDPQFLPLSMVASLHNPIPLDTPNGTRKAFTVLFSTTNPSPTDVEIKFADAGNFYMIDRDNEGNVYNFVNLFSSPPITVVRVPEPATCVLVTLGLGGVLVQRRWRSVRK